jgi:hypothetical protein
MFGIIAPHDDELTLSVKVERIDETQTRLPRAASRHPQTPSKQHPEDHNHQNRGDQEGDHRQAEHHGLVVHQVVHRRHGFEL